MDGSPVESGEYRDAGLKAVGADEIAGVQGLAVGVDLCDVFAGLYASEDVLPMEANAESDSSIEE